MRLSIFLLAGALVCACSTPKKIDFEKLDDAQYVYIRDFQSKIAQEKMRIMKSQFGAAKTGVFFVDAVGNSLNDPRQQDRYTHPGKVIKRVLIVNKSNQTLYANLLTDLKIDQEHSCSVLDIQLPKSTNISILVAYHQQYTLEWNYQGSEKKSYGFTPSSESVLKVSEKGVNPTVLIY
jgi:hypothetical protein